MEPTRRAVLASVAKSAAAVVAAPFVNTNSYVLAAGAPRRYSKRAIDLVADSLVIDMLGLLTLDWDKQRLWFSDPNSLTPAEVAKVQRSGIGVFHPAIEYPSDSPRSFAETYFTDWTHFVSRHAAFCQILDARDLEAAKQQKKTGILLGMQNSNHFSDVADVALFHRLGQRVSQLTYNSKNLLGTGCIERNDTGLTPFGAAVVSEMNRVGMAIDVSHVGDRTTLETIRLSPKPVLITHSNCRALVPSHPRCKSDATIRECANRGGVMGITAIRSFVRPRGDATLDDALDHFDHVARLVGVEHIGIGSDNDLDGRDQDGRRPRFDINGLDHPQRVYDLTEGLIKRRYSNDSIRLILGDNFRRALQEIWSPPIEASHAPLPINLPKFETASL